MRVLLPVDGSTCATRAARYVAKHTSLLGKKPDIILMNVDPPLLEKIGARIGPEDVARFHGKNVHVALRPARRVLSGAHVRYRERIVVGEPGASIARIAREEHCELIVMGSHGRGALKSLFLGSVVMRVLAQARIPVLVVR